VDLKFLVILVEEVIFFQIQINQNQDQTKEMVQMGRGEAKTNYTMDGLIILPPNVLITKNTKKPKMYIFDFTTIQMKKQDNFYDEILNELKDLFKFGLGNAEEV
jgi:hypothetical protein